MEFLSYSLFVPYGSIQGPTGGKKKRRKRERRRRDVFCLYNAVDAIFVRESLRVSFSFFLFVSQRVVLKLASLFLACEHLLRVSLVPSSSLFLRKTNDQLARVRLSIGGNHDNSCLLPPDHPRTGSLLFSVQSSSSFCRPSTTLSWPLLLRRLEEEKTEKLCVALDFPISHRNVLWLTDVPYD